ncbi:unnamed protein product [Ranitomeya imitator]|uniref:Uncharacterized protein n=1 Tax=Ranitomeya imitator TaxID=111125 RepID=A0ABN9LGZ8_9NEOB|nr:unnamed protein product [Ranitomeya imitator]
MPNQFEAADNQLYHSNPYAPSDPLPNAQHSHSLTSPMTADRTELVARSCMRKAPPIPTQTQPQPKKNLSTAHKGNKCCGPRNVSRRQTSNQKKKALILGFRPIKWKPNPQKW